MKLKWDPESARTNWLCYLSHRERWVALMWGSPKAPSVLDDVGQTEMWTAPKLVGIILHPQTAFLNPMSNGKAINGSCCVGAYGREYWPGSNKKRWMIRCDVSEHENIRGHTACYLESNLHQTETDVELLRCSPSDALRLWSRRELTKKRNSSSCEFRSTMTYARLCTVLGAACVDASVARATGPKLGRQPPCHSR